MLYPWLSSKILELRGWGTRRIWGGTERSSPFFMVQYPPLLFFFSLMLAQLQQTDGYRSYCTFFDTSGWYDYSYWSEPKLSFPITEMEWVAPNSLYYCSRQWFIIWTPCDAGCVTFICPRPWDIIDISLPDRVVKTTMLSFSQNWWRW